MTPVKSPVCILNAGYSCGWISKAYNTKLVCVEVSCKAAGHNVCTFVVSTPEKIEEHVTTYLTECARLEDMASLTTLLIHKHSESHKSDSEDKGTVFSRFFGRNKR